MKKMTKYLFSFGLSSIVYLLLSITPAAADVSCQPIYGGGQTCVQVGPALINKMVSHPQTGTFVDNLGPNDAKFSPDQVINFQLIVTNNGSTMLSNVTVKDIFPAEVTAMSGPGSIDTTNRTITFNLTNLNPGESRTTIVSGKVVSADQLPANQVIDCPINQSLATTNSQTSADNSQFCIQKQVVGAQVTPVPSGAPSVTKGGLKVFPPPTITTTPPTGPEALALMALLPTGLLGHILRRKSVSQ